MNDTPSERLKTRQKIAETEQLIMALKDVHNELKRQFNNGLPARVRVLLLHSDLKAVFMAAKVATEGPVQKKGAEDQHLSQLDLFGKLPEGSR